jgi:hypothetical protein
MSTSKQDEAALILKLYELRREETMRKARDWYFREFNPQTLADFNDAIMGPQSAYLRMVVSYWDMAAALVENGAISQEFFTSTNNEYLGMFSKVEKLLPEIRQSHGAQFAANVEKLIDKIPDGRKKISELRERMNAIREQFIARQAKAAQKSATNG